MPLSICYASERQLSVAQRQFAQDHNATLGLPAGTRRRAVFLYTDDGLRTYRWLVDPAGSVLDFTVLRYSRGARAKRLFRDRAGHDFEYAKSLPRWPTSAARQSQTSSPHWTVWIRLWPA